MNIQITKLPRPESCGDWHDKPLRWLVSGPACEAQKFSTKADAKLYARIRRDSMHFIEASREFVRVSLLPAGLNVTELARTSNPPVGWR